ncbi:MAG: uracil-DNA glycosylase [Alphaproteobacteria bacterium]|jgi:uracil-DNA glycosylase family 4|nr:uracil-DNA glycosylase [Alphaproteobacteria bacterium]MDP6563488.1 uracil-DNA glycosylase [Alphaproteobacteria bacterium]MDP6812674.1 uracil-DNA glycosylase [Alphaproteobacteria bacterium]
MENQQSNPDWFNGAVAGFGDATAPLLIVGLAPGLSGANRTGRPFTGDYAGDLLYETLADFGFSDGRYDRRPDDGLALRHCRITNAVRCVPPKNKPTGEEIRTCRRFLVAELSRRPAPRAVLALGRVAHDSILTALDLRRAHHPFSHCARHPLGDGRVLFDSYHCSRYNTNTGRLTPEMFAAVFQAIRRELDDLELTPS